MQLPRIVSFAMVFLTFGLVSYAIPTGSPGADLTKRDSSDIEGVLNTLKSSTDSILPQIDSLVKGNNASDSTVQPLISDLTDALNTASGSLKSLQSSKRAVIMERQSDQDIANLVSGIVSDIVNTLDGLLDSSAVGDLSSLLGGVDSALKEVLQGLETLLQGVLKLVAALLQDVANLLQKLAFGLTLGILGL